MSGGRMTTKVDAFTAAYLAAAVWAAPDNDKSENRPAWDNASPTNLPAETIAQAVKDCDAFRKTVAWTDSERELTDYSDAQAGHDFFLTRNHHGAGFWDRGLGEIGEELTKAAHAFGENDLYVGDDNRIYWYYLAATTGAV